MKTKNAFIIFGITSNLAQTKLIPALYDLEKNNLLSDDFLVIGIGRNEKTADDFHGYLNQILYTKNRHHQHPIEKKASDRLLSKISYLQGDVTNQDLYQKLVKLTKSTNKIFYLATYPNLYQTIFASLISHGLSKQGALWSKLIIEKPLGTDLESAQNLNKLLSKYFEEDQIFRLDHYLGKETLQNIIDFRFGNNIFEPLINSNYVDNIQITAAEDFGIGKRGNYYDQVGALKDVGQNHILQLLALATMDRPADYTNQDITKERIKLIKSLLPMPENIVLGQYKGYLQEENVSPNSKTDTFFALKTFINNDRFRHVPIYIRAGKMLATTATEANIIFKSPANKLFQRLECHGEQNVLTYRIQPNEGIVLKILVRDHGHKRVLKPSRMQFCNAYLPGEPVDAYEKLIYDAINGDQTFFNDAPEVEAQWKFIDPLTRRCPKPLTYPPQTWGPQEADELIEKDGKKWIKPSEEFCPT